MHRGTDYAYPVGQPFFAYLLLCADGSYYVGHTDNLRQRMIDHNAGKNASSAPFRPWRLVTYLAFSGKGQALSFERYLKGGSGHAFAARRLWTTATARSLRS